MSGFPTVSFLEIDGKVLSGEEFEEYCKDHGLCRRCARVRTHRRVLKLFGRGKKWEPMTLHDEDTGDYTVYKGYCLQPTCYTIGQAKRLLGETGSGRRKTSRKQRLKERFKREKRRPGKRKTKTNPETGSVMSGMDDYSISSDTSGMSNMSGLSAMSGMSGMSGFSGLASSFRRGRKKSNRSSSNMSSASSVSSYDFSDDDTIDSTMTPAPQTIVPGQPSPIVAHRVEQLVMYDYFTVLDLSKVELRQEDIDAIVGALKKTKQLESVTMDKCKLKDDGLEQIAAGLQEGNHVNLKKLSLRQNSIGNRGAQSLEFLFKTSPTLEEVDLSENSISSRGAASIFSSLYSNTNTVIHTLNLSQNEIWDMDDGSFLRNNSSLRILNLDGNFMHDEGAEQISKAIAENRNCKIEKLYLGWNGISDDGATALSKMMEVNSTLQVLGLAENDISNTGARAILSALAVNTSVREISGLYHNQIDRKFIIVAIKRLLHRYGERTGQPVPVATVEGGAGVGEEQKTAHEEKEQLADGDDHSGVSDSSSINWAAQLYSTGDDPNKDEGKDRSSSVALEAIEHWDWGTFGIEEIEAAKEDDKSKGEEDAEAETAQTDSAQAPTEAPPASATKAPPRADGTMPSDRITVFQSAPLAYFNRKTAQHHEIPLMDFEYEANALKEALIDKDALGSDIELCFDSATTNRFEVFFSQRASRVMHISCHGQPDCFALENGFGYMQALPPTELKRFVSKGDLQVVLISSCYAPFIANQFLAAGVPHVVCCQREAVFRDEAPVEFAKAFYQTMARNGTVKEAFSSGLDAVKRSPLVRDVRNLSDKFFLLPRKLATPAYHDVKVFFEKPLEQTPELVIGDTSMLPALPEQFVGREVDMYEILESLRVDDVIRVGGIQGSGKSTVLSAVSRYILERPKSFQINSVFWLPPPEGVVADQDSLYGDLCQVINWLVKAEDDIWDEEDYTECRERIMIELEDTKTILVIDGRIFTTEAAGENLERFLTHLLNEANVKIILITAHEGTTSRTKRSRSEETIITIGPLGFKASSLLFGNACPHISATGNPVVHNGEEFADFLVPPSVRKLGADQDKGQLSRRQTELFERMGKGIPKDIMEVANKFSADDLDSLLRFAKRAEVNIKSATELETELSKRTAEKERAVAGKNFLRAQDLTATIEELTSLKSQYPSLTDLQNQEKAYRAEFSTLLREKKYDAANAVKRKILALKKVMLKEKHAQPKGDGAKFSSSNRLKELEKQMEQMMALAEKMKTDKPVSQLDPSNNLKDDANSATFVIDRKDGQCLIEILCGSIEEFNYEFGMSGVVVWTNESCDLSTHATGKKILEYGAHKLEEEMSTLPSVADTEWGPSKCPIGESVIVGPRSYSKLSPRYIALAVSPLSESCDDDNWDGDSEDLDALHYLDTGLRASYRSSLRKLSDAGLEAVGVSTITTRENGTTYERTLRVGLHTVVQEAKFSGFKSVRLLAASDKEANSLIKMALGMGLTASSG